MFTDDAARPLFTTDGEAAAEKLVTAQGFIPGPKLGSSKTVRARKTVHVYFAGGSPVEEMTPSRWVATR